MKRLIIGTFAIVAAIGAVTTCRPARPSGLVIGRGNATLRRVRSVLPVGTLSAQEKTPAAAEPPQLAPDLAQAIRELQVQISGIARAQAVLQKELDAETAQFQRVIQQAQATCAAVPGYELAPTLTCAKKPEPARKDPPK